MTMVSPWHRLVYICIVCIPLLVSISAFLIYWLEFMQSALEADVTEEVFDFIIVGGGSAGAVLANRLTEVPGYKVLLLEAGGAPSPLSSIPALASFLQLSPYDWGHKTVPQERACGGMVDRRCVWPSGKLLGGTSGINYMLYVRGNPKDYDSWNENGNPGWSYNSIKKYFLKSEKNVAGHPGEHGRDGYLPVDDSKFTTPMEQEYLRMVKRLGYEVKDLNIASNQTGFMVPHVNLENGVRGDTYRSYLKPVLDRSNLWIRKHSRVIKIEIEKGRAIGVTFSRYGALYTVRARKEILLSAGAINSPKLLMLSGIGPPEHLQKLGIKVEVDLPVGLNLQDHLTTMLGPFILNTPLSFEPSRLLSYSTFRDYLFAGDGPMAATSACDLLGFINTRNNTQTDHPDIQLLFLSSSLTSDYWTHLWTTFGLKESAWEEYFSKFYFPKNMNAVSILPILLRPKSRGTVKLKSKEHLDTPLIDPQYLAREEDVELLVESILLTLQMVQADPNLQKLGYQLPELHYPGCEELQLWSRAYWRCYIRQLSLTMYHPIGTCKMSPDSSGVVNHELKVKGVEGLRVVDASIIPDIISGNTNAAVVMIGEKAADMIKFTWADHPLRRRSKDEL